MKAILFALLFGIIATPSLLPTPIIVDGKCVLFCSGVQ